MQETYEKCHHFMKNGGKMICAWEFGAFGDMINVVNSVWLC